MNNKNRLDDNLTSEQQKLRDSILNINGSSYNYGVADFEKLNVDSIKRLVANGFIKLTDKFNDSPDIKCFLGFMVKHPEVTCFGYSCRRRNEFWVGVTGIESYNVHDKNTLIDFFITFRLADQFEETEKYCKAWYD